MEFYYIPTPEEMYSKHFTGIPNVFFDKVMGLLDTQSWAVLCVFLRQLYGFQRNTYKLSERAIAEKTGLNKATVSKRIDKLLSFGLITITKEADKPRRIAREYTLFTGKISF